VRKTRRPSTPEEDHPVAAASVRYIESSALVAALLERDAEALAEVREIGHRVTSALTVTEATRALLRARKSRRIGVEVERAGLRHLRKFERSSTIIAVSEEILARAGRPFPVEPIRTLDAIHLATIESMSDVPQLVTVVTRDARVARNARALGYAVASGE
jgi:predicted nucleic acid-binding protein